MIQPLLCLYPQTLNIFRFSTQCFGSPERNLSRQVMPVVVLSRGVRGWLCPCLQDGQEWAMYRQRQQANGITKKVAVEDACWVHWTLWHH